MQVKMNLMHSKRLVLIKIILTTDNICGLFSMARSIVQSVLHVLSHVTHVFRLTATCGKTTFILEPLGNIGINVYLKIFSNLIRMS